MAAAEGGKTAAPKKTKAPAAPRDERALALVTKLNIGETDRFVAGLVKQELRLAEMIRDLLDELLAS